MLELRCLQRRTGMDAGQNEVLRWWQQRAESHRVAAKNLKTPAARRTILKLADMADRCSRPEDNNAHGDPRCPRTIPGTPDFLVLHFDGSPMTSAVSYSALF